MHRIFAWGAPLHTLRRAQFIPRPADVVFAFFQEPGNLQLITPPDIGFEVLSCEPNPIEQGSVIRYRIRTFGVRHGWTTHITRWDPPVEFVDTQASGPYVLWEHRHRFEPQPGGVVVTDFVRYRIPFGPLGELLHALLIRRRLEYIFDYRRQKIMERF